MELTNLLVPVGWRLSTVGDSCEIDNHLRAPISSDVRKDMRGEYPYYGPTGILDYIEEYRVEGEYALIAEDGDHFLKYENVDMTLFVSGKFNVNNHAHLVKGKGDCSTEWVYDFFRRANLYPFITRQGAGRYKLNKAALQELLILIPPLPEQRKIAEILRTWDEAIATVEQLIAALQWRKKGLMQRLLTGQVRFPKYADQPWESKSIGELLKQVSRPIKWSDEDTYDLLSIRRRSEGIFIRQQLRGSEINTKQMYEAHEGDFLISKMQIVHGASALTTKQYHRKHISNSYVALVARDTAGLDIRFFDWLSRTPELYRIAYVSSHGVHIEKMSFDLDDYLNHLVRIPPTRVEQERIVAVLESAQEEINLTNAYMIILAKQKKGLMQRLLTGQVRVQV